MSTANFKSMKDFPLIVMPEFRCKVCPDCGITCGEDDAACPDCGASLADVEVMNDECEEDYIAEEMHRFATRLNEYLHFYEVSVESGYYTGCQFYVDEKYSDVAAMCNEETKEEFGLCRSVTLRKYNSEGNFIRRELQRAKKEIGLWELGITARFFNGETWYSKVG